MTAAISRIVLLALFVIASQAAVRAAAAGEVYAVFVSSNGWHTGIVVASDDIPAGRIPEAADFPEAAYLEFGWGDADFYPKPDAGLFAAIGAAFPGPAVMHVAALTARPSQFFADVEEVEIELGMEEFGSLMRYLHESFEREGDRASASAPGLYAFSRFYPASGTFSLSNTCNTWTARGLELAGVNVESRSVRRAEDLMKQLRPLAAANADGGG